MQEIIIKLKKIYSKYDELILYICFGGLTTLVNYIVYFISTRIFGVDILYSNVVSWFLAVLFAYITNRHWVFQSKAKNVKEIVCEGMIFICARVTSGILDTVLLAIFCNIMHINDLVVKIFNSVLVTVFNYFFSKWIVFRKTDRSK